MLFSHCKCCSLESHITIFLLPYVFYYERFTTEYHLDFKIVNILLIIEKAREFQQNIYFCFTDYTKAFHYVDHNKLWKILQEMGIPDHLICLLRNLYADHPHGWGRQKLLGKVLRGKGQSADCSWRKENSLLAS